MGASRARVDAAGRVHTHRRGGRDLRAARRGQGPRLPSGPGLLLQPPGGGGGDRPAAGHAGSASGEDGLKAAQELLREALAREADAHQLLLEGESEAAGDALREVAELYRRSWELAPPGAFGRLIGVLKAAVLAGGGAPEAAYARGELGHPDGPGGSATESYAIALAAVVSGDDELARRAAGGMRGGGDAFERTAEAIDALAARDGQRYAVAVAAIVDDFERRGEHLTGVPFADTAAVLERVAAGRGIAAGIASPLLPPADG